jgi:hypothetical protein
MSSFGTSKKTVLKYPIHSSGQIGYSQKATLWSSSFGDNAFQRGGHAVYLNITLDYSQRATLWASSFEENAFQRGRACCAI